MVAREIIIKIIEAGNAAPSGENTQPWRFEVSNDSIDLMIPETYYAHRSILEKDLYTIHLAHGAVLENMAIAADHYGYFADISLFPEPTNELVTARISLREDLIDHHVDLYQFIATRGTRREQYRGDALTETQRYALTSFTHPELPRVQIRLIEDKKTIAVLARAVARQVQMIFTEKKLHQSFFKNIRFSIADNYRFRDGLNVKTLSLSILQTALLYILQHWHVVKFLHVVGIHRVAFFLESIRYRHTSAYCALVGTIGTARDTVNVGRLMERVWLLGTRAQLVMQPTFATFLLRDHSEPGTITEKNMRTLTTAANEIERAFRCDNEYPHVLLLFRLGNCHPDDVPVASSLRKKPDIRFT